MELKTLFIGLLFAMGIFAVKSGVGIHYLLTQKEGIKSRSVFLCIYGLVYLLIFLFCTYIIRQMDMMAYFEMVREFLKFGMGLHLLMAAGLLIWGLLLLKSAGKPGKGKYAWIALIVPCPVCLTVIFLSLSFLISYFPDSVHLAAISAYGAFLAIVSTTIMAMTLWRHRSNKAPELTIGTAMVLIAIYFLLSLVVLPQFGNVERIYRLAAYQGQTRITEPNQLWLLLSIITAFLAMGFIGTTKKLKMRWKWT